jgi:hypothetical protein
MKMDEDKLYDSRLGRFTPEIRTSALIGDWANPRTDLDAVKKRKISAPTRKRNLTHRLYIH